jgi:hypothetical protein
MTHVYFSVATPNEAIYYGKSQLDINLATATYNGYLAGMEATNGSLILSTGSPMGHFYEFMAMQELPASANLATYMPGKETNIATGVYLAFCGHDLFEEATLPAYHDAIYVGCTTPYLMNHTTGATRIGTCLNRGIYVQLPAGQQEVALIAFDFTSVL